MRPIALLVLLTLCGALAPAALGGQRNAAYVELFGPAVLGSVNYERAVAGRFTARVGLGAVPELLDVGATVHAPVMVNYLAGRGEHRLEIGAGVVLVHVLPHSRREEERATASPGFRRPDLAGTLAYRWQPRAGTGAFYRFGFTPIVHGGRVAPLFGASAGVAF